MAALQRLAPVLILLLIAGLFFIPTHTAQAATFNIGCGATRVTDLINAISSANSAAGSDIINLTAGCTYTLTSVNNGTGTIGETGLPAIVNNGALTINGSGAIIERSSAGGTPDFRLLYVDSNATLTLNNLTLRGGRIGNSGGGVFVSSGATVHVTNNTIANNTVLGGNTGGAFTNLNGTVFITNSTFSGNSGNGGAVFNQGGSATLTVSNSTFSGNANPSGSGNAILNSIGTVNITSSTFSDNTGIAATISNSGGLMTMNNSIVANSTGGDCQSSNGGNITGSHNLIETACVVSGGTVNLSNTITADPVLGALANNGGPTNTYALLAGSPALDAGNNSLLAGASIDQRGVGFPRIVATTADIGAFEAVCGVSPYSVASSDEPGLIRAVNCANTDNTNSIINLTSSVYTLTAVNNSSGGHGGNGLPVILNNGTLTINGNGAAIDRSKAPGTLNFRLIFINSGVTLSLNDLRIRGGLVAGFNGGGLFNNGGTLTLTNSTVSSNETDQTGGGLFNNAGTVNIINSTFSGNLGSNGAGAIRNMNTGTVNIVNSTFSANDGGNSTGGALHNAGTAQITNSTFSGNVGVGATLFNLSGTVTLNNSIIANASSMCHSNGGSISGSHNLIEVTCGSSSGGTVNLSNTVIDDPALAALTGSPAYHPLSAFSPAIDAGSNTNATGLTTDQAGNPRFFNDTGVTDTGAGSAPIVDIGAVEKQSNSAQPTVSIGDVTSNEGNSGTRVFSFLVTLSNPIDAMVNAAVNTGNGSAIAGSDYTAITGIVIFQPGETSKVVSITVHGDTLFEGNETFIVDLSNPNNATLADSQAIGTITNDDTPPSIDITNVTITEGNSGTKAFNFTVSLNTASAVNTTVQFATSNGSAIAPGDYTATNGTLTFSPGQTSKTVTVLVNGETMHEPHETFNLDLSNPTNATIANNQGVGQINNDDSKPTIRVNDLARTEGGVGVQTNLPFTVTLSNPSHETITVQFVTSDGTATIADSDYTAIGLTTLSFAPGVTSRNVTVKITGDAKHEPHETLNFTLSNPTNATIGDNLGVGTIANDDSKPSIAVNNVTQPEGNSGTTNFAFVVTLSHPSHETITVNFATSNGTATAGTDYTARSGSLSFAPGVTSRNLTVVGNGDTTVEPNETFNFNLSAAVNATIADALGVATISNDDAAGLSDEGVQIVPVAPELPQFLPVAPVMPDVPSVELPGVMLVSPMHATSENPVAFTWIGTADAVGYRVLVQQQHDRASVVDITVSAATCNGNICVFVSQFAPQMGVGYVWTVTPITAAGAGQPSAEAGFSYSPSAPDGIELPGTIIGG